MDQARPERPASELAARRGGDRPGAHPSGLDGRPPRRHAPETSEPDGTPSDGYAHPRRTGGVGPPGHDQPHRGRHGSGGYAVDRSGAERHGARGRAAGRHGADERVVDDRYPGEHTSARHDDTVEYGSAGTVGYEPGRHGSRSRPDGYAHARPGPDDVERVDRGYLDRRQPGYASDEFGPEEYDPYGRDLDRYAPDGYGSDQYWSDEYASDEYDSDEYDGPDGYASEEHEHGHDSDDDRTALFPAGGGETGRRRAPDDGHDDPAAEGPGRESPRRRARAGPSDERPTRRRRWPWVLGVVAVAAAIVLLALTVLGGTEEPRRSSPAGNVVGTGTPSGTGQAAAAPSAAGPAPPPAAAQVTYEVTGSGSAGTITVSRGRSVTQLSDAELPWKQTSPAVEGPAEYSLTAAGASGEMSCKIVVGDAVLAEEKSDGDFGAVSCNGRR